MTRYDVVIIGAGPAGLASAQALSALGIHTALIDAGRQIQERKKDIEHELTQGHGGAGLYSDGKFSFFPSATALWTLPDKESLRDAFKWTCDVLQPHGLKTPTFPETDATLVDAAGEWTSKTYPSDYLPLQARQDLTHDLVETLSSDVIVKANVYEYEYHSEKRCYDIKLAYDTGLRDTIESQCLVIATGRFGPLGMGVEGSRIFRRLEVGFRIEQPSSESFFHAMPQLDPKLKLRSQDGNAEWRTFCACREGSTVYTRTLDMWTVSGHSDGPPTGRSNVGFNTRILDDEIARSSLAHLTRMLKSPDVYFELSMQDVLRGDKGAIDRLSSIYGEKLKEFMIEGLQHLVQNFPAIDSVHTKLIGPTLEGIGWYPELNGNLRLADSPTWVIGDACGIFRGIIAAFISGRYAAKSISDFLTGERLQNVGERYVS